MPGPKKVITIALVTTLFVALAWQWSESRKFVWNGKILT